MQFGSSSSSHSSSAAAAGTAGIAFSDVCFSVFHRPIVRLVLKPLISVRVMARFFYFFILSLLLLPFQHRSGATRIELFEHNAAATAAAIRVIGASELTITIIFFFPFPGSLQADCTKTTKRD